MYITSQDVDDRIYITREWTLPDEKLVKKNNFLISQLIRQAKTDSFLRSLKFESGVRCFLNRAKEHGALGKSPSFWRKKGILVFKIRGSRNHYILVIDKYVYPVIVSNNGWMYQSKEETWK